MNENPIENFERRVAEAVKRLDDLRDAETRRINGEMELRDEHAKGERAMAQAAVLATQSTASTVAQQLAQISSQFNDRLVTLEKSQYENSGSKGGSRDVWGWVFGIAVALMGFGITIYFALHK